MANTPSSTLDLLLDDGEFYITLDPTSLSGRDISKGFLERRCLAGAPERIGSFEMQADGNWTAAVAASATASAGAGFVVVTSGVERVPAIVALWRARRDAYLGQYAL